MKKDKKNPKAILDKSTEEDLPEEQLWRLCRFFEILIQVDQRNKKEIERYRRKNAQQDV